MFTGVRLPAKESLAKRNPIKFTRLGEEWFHCHEQWGTFFKKSSIITALSHICKHKPGSDMHNLSVKSSVNRNTVSAAKRNIIFFLQKGTDRCSITSHIEGQIPIDNKHMFRRAGHFCMVLMIVAVSVNKWMYEVLALQMGAPGNLLNPLLWQMTGLYQRINILWWLHSMRGIHTLLRHSMSWHARTRKTQMLAKNMC